MTATGINPFRRNACRACKASLLKLALGAGLIRWFQVRRRMLSAKAQLFPFPERLRIQKLLHAKQIFDMQVPLEEPGLLFQMLI